MKWMILLLMSMGVFAMIAYDYLSPNLYHRYITPDDEVVKGFAANYYSIEDAYDESTTWLWVDDKILYGEEDYWAKPREVLTSRNNPNNPTMNIAGDCEDKAHTLTSIMRAMGVDNQSVRVCIGDMKDGGQHAWVEVNDDRVGWYPIEPSSGYGYNGNDGSFILYEGFPYYYFRTKSYPVDKKLICYNDEVMWDFAS